MKARSRTATIDRRPNVEHVISMPDYVDTYDLSHLSPGKKMHIIRSSDGDERLFTALLNQERFYQDWQNGMLSPEADPVKLTEQYQATIDDRRRELGLIAMHDVET